MYSQEAAENTPNDTNVSKNLENTLTNIANDELEDDKLYKQLEIELRGHDPEVMKSYEWFARTAAEHLGIEVGKW